MQFVRNPVRGINIAASEQQKIKFAAALHELRHTFASGLSAGGVADHTVVLLAEEADLILKE